MIVEHPRVDHFACEENRLSRYEIKLGEFGAYPLRSPAGCLFLQITRFMEQGVDRVCLETQRVLNSAQEREAQLSTGFPVNEGILQQIMRRFEPVSETETKPQLLEALARQRAAARKWNVGPHRVGPKVFEIISLLLRGFDLCKSLKRHRSREPGAALI